jgi:ABC-type nitrate/sulfonate/bicarbonate transport system ATPase subunit
MLFMAHCLDSIIDALDVETFVVAKDENEAKEIIKKIMTEMGLKDIDIVYCQHLGPGARVRARGYIFRAGDKYGWLKGADGK